MGKRLCVLFQQGKLLLCLLTCSVVRIQHPNKQLYTALLHVKGTINKSRMWPCLYCSVPTWHPGAGLVSNKHVRSYHTAHAQYRWKNLLVHRTTQTTHRKWNKRCGGKTSGTRAFFFWKVNLSKAKRASKMREQCGTQGWCSVWVGRANVIPSNQDMELHWFIY